MKTRQFLAIEAQFASGEPFGSAPPMLERVHRRYRGRLVALEPHLDAAGALQAGAGDRPEFLRDPVLRQAIDSAYIHFQGRGVCAPIDPATARQVLTAAARELEVDNSVSALLSRAACAQASHGELQLRLWRRQHTQDVVTETFDRLVALQTDGLARLTEPGDVHLQSLTGGLALLDEVVPSLARSALDHVHIAAVVDHVHGGSDKERLQYRSFSGASIPGAIFLFPEALKTPWSAAEHVLHESLHQKLADMLHCYSIFSSGSGLTGPPFIRAVWNRSSAENPNRWPVLRSLYALHVHVGLALMFSIAASRLESLVSRYGPAPAFPPGQAARRSLDRARYLAQEVLVEGKETLGAGGLSLVQWLMGLLEQLDTDPPAALARSHLYLDLYERESKEMHALLTRAARSDAGADLPRLRQVVERVLTRDLACLERLGGRTATDSDAPVLAASTLSALADTFGLTRQEMILSFKALRRRLYASAATPEAVQALEEEFRFLVEGSATDMERLTAGLLECVVAS